MYLWTDPDERKEVDDDACRERAETRARLQPSVFSEANLVSARSIIANPSRSCASVMHSGGFVKNVCHRTNV